MTTLLGNLGALSGVAGVLGRSWAISSCRARGSDKPLMMPVTSGAPGSGWISAKPLSRESELYIGYLVTTNQGDGGGSVEVFPNQFPAINTRNRTTIATATIDLERNVLLPPRTWRKEQNLPERFARLWASARRHQANKIIEPSNPQLAPPAWASSPLPRRIVISARAR